jgi:hypothetical protein
MKRFLSSLFVLVILAMHPLASVAQAAGAEPTDCRKLASQTPLATLEVARVSSGPNRLSAWFASPTANGLLCVENHGTTSGGISLNGTSVVAPREFKGAPSLIAHSVTLTVSQNNDNHLIATISGQVGQSFTVRVYGQ